MGGRFLGQGKDVRGRNDTPPPPYPQLLGVQVYGFDKAEARFTLKVPGYRFLSPMPLCKGLLTGCSLYTYERVNVAL